MTAKPHQVRIDPIPAIWLEPPAEQPDGRLAILLTGLGGRKEDGNPF